MTVTVEITHIANVLAPVLGEAPEVILKSLRAIDTDNDGRLTLVQCEEVLKTYPHLPDRMPQWQRVIAPTAAGGGRTETTHNLSIVESLVSGGIAGAISKTVIAPGDRVKILYQVSSKLTFSFRSALGTGATIVGTEGVFGLWTGNGAMMIRVVPYSAITYMTFDRYNKAMGGDQRFLAGAFAGATAVTLTYPLDLMRARLAAHQGPVPLYESYYVAFHSTATKEGWRALYHGLTPTLLGIMPYAGTTFAVYGALKRALVQSQKFSSEQDLPKWQLLVVGGFSGIVGQSATYPLDIMRRRMQVRSGQYSSVMDCARQIYLKEGWRAFYKGLSMNWVKGPIAVGVSFTVNDSMKLRIREYHIDEAKSISAAKEAGNEPRLTILESMVSGGFAGAAAKFWTSPMERVKILYQVNPSRHITVTKVVKSARMIMGSSGVLGLWRGSGITMVRVVPYAAITYSTYDVMKYHTPRLMFTQERDPMTTFLAGAIAGVVATTVTYPFDVLRTRMAAHWSPEPKYASAMAGLKTTIEQEGIRSLTAGLRPALVGIAPFVGINFAMYESFKPYLGHEPSFYQRVALGAASAVVAQTCTYPLHIVSRRLQVHDVMTHGGPLYGSVSSALQEIYRKEGFVQGLYKGVRMTWMLGPLAVGLSFSINDMSRDFFFRYKSKVHDEYQMILARLLPPT